MEAAEGPREGGSFSSGAAAPVLQSRGSMQAPSGAPHSFAGSVLLSAVGTGLPHIDAQDADAAVWWMRFLLPAPPRPSGDAQALAGTGFHQMADAVSASRSGLGALLPISEAPCRHPDSIGGNESLDAIAKGAAAQASLTIPDRCRSPGAQRCSAPQSHGPAADTPEALGRLLLGMAARALGPLLAERHGLAL